MRGKLILIEGTDCSGKQTQSELLIEKLLLNGYKVINFSFPDYNSPTGQIIGGPYLGKPSICESYFKEGATFVNPKIAGHYFAADRLDKKEMIENHLKKGNTVILDRYVESNMAHQGSKYKNKKDRIDFYNWCKNMEYINNGLPKPDMVIFLHMPYLAALDLKKDRTELDDHEKDENHLKKAEACYVELSQLYNWKIIDCLKENHYKNYSSIKTKQEISEEVYNKVVKFLNE